MLQIWCFWEKVRALEKGYWVGAIEVISDDEHDGMTKQRYIIASWQIAMRIRKHELV
jgi:hypothetical protein